MQSYDPRVKRWDPPAIMLAALFGGVAGNGGTVDFAVPIPDSRLRVKVTLLWVPADGLAYGLGFDQAQTLWLAEREEDRSGRRGGMAPVANLFGTSSAPVSIAGDGSVSGFSREFNSAADEIFGRLTATKTGNGNIGRWMLQTRYQPDTFISDCEWELIKPYCSPAARSDIINVPGTGQ